MKRLQALFVAFVIGSIWVSPACKSNEVNQEENTEITYKSVVGPQGKTWETAEGVKIRIPPGALDEDIVVSITEAKPGEYPVTESPGGAYAGDMTPWTAVGKVWAFEPHGQKFFVEATMWLPAPPGHYEVMRAQPGGKWEGGFNTVLQPVDGKVEFTTKSFSFYTLRKFDFDGPVGDATPVTPCEACQNSCRDRCAKDAVCLDDCLKTCADACAGPSDGGGGDGDPGGTPDAFVPDTSTCMPMCPPGSGGPGAPCKSCGGSMPCTVSTGSTTWDCTCASDMLTACAPRTTGGDAATDTAVDDSGDAGMCGGCPGSTVPLRPGDGTSPCCKLVPSTTMCAPPSSAVMNPCTGSQYICRDTTGGCL